ncbi:hypothetical protein JCM19235_1325 [Vibrio maritimus]|uniref:Uncharacterized protein n=1 Tax=Vibrio maritimus TaxID=990268 RepID=A0A090S953_9VIBR|nr:hypothetical protein JCM19235_1325 [Vibrio maritimus]
MKILLNHAHPMGRSFAAKLPCGKIKAGSSEKEARTFDSPRDAISYFMPYALEGDHGAWNICYTLEDLL